MNRIPRLLVWNLAAATLAGFAPAAGHVTANPQAQPAETRPAPLRALVLVGGEYHAVEANAKRVVEILKSGEGAGISATMVRIDRPPAGRPSAEKPSLPSDPDILKDPDLIKKFDLILQYTQDSYVDHIEPDHVDGLLHFIRSGGSWIGWHCAADTFKGYPEFVRMVGGKFETHPAYGPVEVKRIAAQSPVGGGIEDFEVKDELYHLADSTADDKSLLLVARSPGDGKTRPVAWTKRYGLGKVFYTTLGHGPDVYQHPSFVRLLQNAAEWASTPGAGAPAGGAVQLFNGRDLEGWTQCGPGKFTVEGGAITTHGGMGMLWYDRASFGDFVLELEWSVGRKEDNSGIFVRFPTPVNPWTAVNEGYEIQIGDTYDAMHNTGSIYSFKGSTSIPTVAPGGWNRYRIEVRGQKYKIMINDKIVNEFTGSRRTAGHIGLQNHDDDSRVRFRNIRVSQ